MQQEDERAQFLAELNAECGTDFNENDVPGLLTIERRIVMHEGLSESRQGKTPEEARQIFAQALPEMLRSLFEASSRLDQQMQQDQDWAAHFTQMLFEHFQQRVTEERDG